MQWTASQLALLAFYGVPALLVWGLYWKRQRARERVALERLHESETAQLLEPPSLHPLIDPNRCAGCATCVDACPEKDVLGLIDRKAVLVSPANCIGHGACRTACPLDAITLVFGTESRGVDIPHVGENFETNVPGIFIAGELGGMGLIRNAVEQGRQALAEIARRRRARSSEELDVVIVGAGPAGFSATLAAKERQLRAVTLEQESLGGAVAHYPRGKLVMTAPVHLPLYGKVKLRETKKEALLELWTRVERDSEIEISYDERMESLRSLGDGFELTTTRSSYRTRSVLLCIGRRGTPRKLGVPGEDQPKVVYRLTEPDQYAGQHVLVVGGGDSALEAAATLGEEVEGARVTLSYRSPAFSRAKPKNRERVERAAGAGVIDVRLESRVVEILSDSVRLDHGGELLELRNDAVIVCAGGVLPTGMLCSFGIEVETKHGSE